MDALMGIHVKIPIFYLSPKIPMESAGIKVSAISTISITPIIGIIFFEISTTDTPEIADAKNRLQP